MLRPRARGHMGEIRGAMLLQHCLLVDAACILFIVDDDDLLGSWGGEYTTILFVPLKHNQLVLSKKNTISWRTRCRPECVV